MTPFRPRFFLILTACALLLTPCILLAAEPLVVSSGYKDITMIGYTRSSKSVTLTSEVTGKTLAVNYKIGEKITDRPFIEIDETFIQFKINHSQLQLKQIDSRIESMAATVQFLNTTHERLMFLKKNDSISEHKYDESQNKLNETIHELDSLKYEKEMLQITLRQHTEELVRHKITGFKGWTVTACPLQAGEYVQAGTPLAEVSNYSSLMVPFSLSTEEMTAFKALPQSFDGTLIGTPVKARINFINPKFDEKTRKLELELVIEDYTGDRHGGLKFATHIRVKSEGIRVPKAAVKTRFGNPRVILKKNGETLSVMILGENEESLILAAAKKLPPGTVLLPAATHGGG